MDRKRGKWITSDGRKWVTEASAQAWENRFVREDAEPEDESIEPVKSSNKMITEDFYHK